MCLIKKFRIINCIRFDRVEDVDGDMCGKCLLEKGGMCVDINACVKANLGGELFKNRYKQAFIVLNRKD